MRPEKRRKAGRTLTPARSAVTVARPALATARSALSAARPALVAALAGAVVVPLCVLTTYDPGSPLAVYGLRVAVMVAALAGVVAMWWGRRQSWLWVPDLLPALFGAVATTTLLVVLHGTPYGPGGLVADPTFRTEAVTRFADTWRFADFTYRGLPAFYAPGYFWVLGRVAALADIEPWRMLKYGTVAVTLALPVVLYLLWRRLLPAGVAALVAGVPLLVQNIYEPYSWLVLFAIVPWWLDVVDAPARGSGQPRHPVTLGLIGALLFLTYYYFFFIVAIATVLYVLADRLLPAGERTLTRAHTRRLAVTAAVTAAGSAVFWLPLVWNLLHAHGVESLANRWFQPSHADPQLPMAEASPFGLLCLLGLVFLVWTSTRDRLSRGLLVLLVSSYVWYLAGLPAALAGTPLLTFRGAPLAPLTLATAGVLGLARLADRAGTRFSRPGSLRSAFPGPDIRRLVGVAVLVTAVVFGEDFVTVVTTEPLMAAAHHSPLPDGRLPRYHGPNARPQAASVDALSAALDARHPGPGHPVVLTDRADLLAVRPYYGFVQYSAHYSHPAAAFHRRIAFLRKLAAAGSPQQFAAEAARNPYDRIDAFVLHRSGGDLVFRYADDNFPRGIVYRRITFRRGLFLPPTFQVAELGGYLVAVRRTDPALITALGGQRQPLMSHQPNTETFSLG